MDTDISAADDNLCPACGESAEDTGHKATNGRVVLSCGDAVYECADGKGWSLRREPDDLWRCAECGKVVGCTDLTTMRPLMPHCADCARDMDRFDPIDTVFLRDRANGRGHPAGPVFAVFPGLAATVGRPDILTCYSHVGQHGSATISYGEDQSEVTDPAEYADLAAELLDRGYNVRVVPKSLMGHADYAIARRRQLAS
jgi:hypothetical protein